MSCDFPVWYGLTGKQMSVLNIVKAAVGVVVVIAGALYALDVTYCRSQTFAAFTQQYYYDRADDQLDRVNNRIYDLQMKLKKNPGNQFLMEQLHKQQLEKERIERRIERLKPKEGG